MINAPKEPNDREKVIFARLPDDWAATFRNLFDMAKNSLAGEASITIRWVKDNDDLETEDLVPELRFRVKQVGPVEEKE